MSSLGDDSFERFLQEEPEAANGDEEKAMELVTAARVLISFTMKPRGRQDDYGADMAKEDEEAAMTLLSLRGEVATGVTENGAKIHDLHDLPKKLKIKIEKLNGTDVTVVAEKQLYKTDLNKKENRLLIAEKTILNPFLNPDEEKQLDDKEGIQVTVIQPCLETAHNMMLKKWTMNKNKYFALIGNWSSIAKKEENYLKIGCMVRLLSFRKESELFLALYVKA
ncbi:hypothetical protein LWI29_033859 [Acer saccharum]|uniref:B3 domain-containing protein n=1 Tax=Acer saccharum TaxID=4024 RepID=A0AA39RNW3_ACESA|nr:hypothetical protein LWI29_033859 [Acer saccharum]